MLEKLIEKWRNLSKTGKVIVVIVILAAIGSILPSTPKKQTPQQTQQAQEQEEKDFIIPSRHLLKEKVSEDASLNLLDYGQRKIAGKDVTDTQGTFDLNDKKIKFWATFEYSTEKPLRLKVAEQVIFDENKKGPQ
jgi:Na+-transporting NADH:ubiquinone oxidoreductase subunit NqrC